MNNFFPGHLTIALLPGLVIGGIALASLMYMGKKKLSGKAEGNHNGESARSAQPQAEQKPAQAGARLEDGIYQKHKLVGRVLDPEVDLEAKELRIAEIYNSDELVIPDECEFQKFKILIQRIAFATKVDRAEPHKGRILRVVSADILGYREQ